MALSPLRMGARISTATGVARGRIGGFAKDGERLFALVARHVALAEGDGQLYLNEQYIGTVDVSGATGMRLDKRSPMSNAIVAMEIAKDHGAIIVEEAGISVTTAYADPVDALDRRVRTLADSDSFASGAVAWVGSRVRVRHADGSEVHYSEAIEVALDDLGEGELARGDAGMPVIDEGGNLLGLVISGTHSRCFVAPVGPFLEAHSLSLYRLSSAPAEVEGRVEQVAAGLRDVSANLTEWRLESRRTHKLFRPTADGVAQLVLEGTE